MTVCTYGSRAAGCNQEPMRAVVAQVVSRYTGPANVEGNHMNLSKPVVGGA